MTELYEMMQVKTQEGEYVKTAKEVAEFHGVHVNAVYQSRKAKYPDKLDKLMLFEEVQKRAKDADVRFITGDRHTVRFVINKELQEGQEYYFSFKKEGNND